MAAAQAIAELFDSEGARDYLGEPVSVASHLLQAGALASAAGAPDALVAAALLHDIGHLLTDEGDAYGDVRHGASGAAWLASWFPEPVTEPVRLHVPAKRYLCATEPSYVARLSEASVHTLSLQGGPMTAAEASSFEGQPYTADAIAVRRWDDQAKDPSVSPPDFARFRPLLERLLAVS
jgi:gamma-butyrobetaine dioxygenase